MIVESSDCMNKAHETVSETINWRARDVMFPGAPLSPRHRGAEPAIGDLAHRRRIQRRTRREKARWAQGRGFSSGLTRRVPYSHPATDFGAGAVCRGGLGGRRGVHHSLMLNYSHANSN